MTLGIRLIEKLLILTFVSAITAGCDYYKDLPSCTMLYPKRDKGSFVTDEAGLAKDSNTGLIWYRCAGGQRYSYFKCKGEPLKLSWDDAIKYAEEFSKKSGKSWRLPTKKEMKSIMEEKCINPSLNPTVFPNVIVDNFWTASDSLNSDLFRCSVYTYKGDLFCRQPKATKLPFLLIGGNSN